MVKVDPEVLAAHVRAARAEAIADEPVMGRSARIWNWVRSRWVPGGPTWDDTVRDLKRWKTIPACHIWPYETLEELWRRRGHADRDGYSALLTWQAGRCAICGGRDALVDDHDHTTGLIRGLLCASCNTGEGKSDAPRFVAYRQRNPAIILGITVEYVSPWP